MHSKDRKRNHTKNNKEEKRKKERENHDSMRQKSPVVVSTFLELHWNEEEISKKCVDRKRKEMKEWWKMIGLCEIMSTC